ncbi:PREDICTED: uncharacterized protein LOC106812426 [Priapulus caudatus]|uniref:Uncharacterized protein LOC106812426 n=1 Tax=Priapulus caudatus TaxID=37621 RepID=A0ABM1EHW9_PRICU|nr:PREDICTED: uncharacterized protein LOC106812426 [Priapulus caudatus]
MIDVSGKVLDGKIIYFRGFGRSDMNWGGVELRTHETDALAVIPLIVQQRWQADPRSPVTIVNDRVDCCHYGGEVWINGTIADREQLFNMEIEIHRNLYKVYANGDLLWSFNKRAQTDNEDISIFFIWQLGLADLCIT